MIVLTIFYVVITVYKTRQASIMVGGLMVGMSQQETRYLMGPPERIEADGRVWRYSPAGSDLSMVFDGGATRISCTDSRLEIFGCADVLGVGIGASEDDVQWTLGPPTHMMYSGNDKVMRYDDLGLSFTLRRYHVAAIDHFQRSSRYSYMPRAFRVMVPH